ncbi:MAG TPA: AmmeMemoRadiSam system radical SAM enzyme [Methanoregulaceae archaeon]|nr:AmmeMemoRadiSam system radical SAM enzyme [Methanoregulaceae archaeon]HQJ87603.1 AmmeMemoRadiSam system radical SAM enzyme [Methanoregulaceae archaeon]
MHEAALYTQNPDGTVTCRLCNHGCRIADGRSGRCGVRQNRDGRLYAASFGRISAEHIDPIEKKPLNHFLPGTLSYSLGSVGCNFSCTHCQNWQLSRSAASLFSLPYLSPEEAIHRALDADASSVSWTYNEPTISFEYTLEMGRRAHEAGLGTVYVTNGYMTIEALEALAPVLDAFRVDIKAFDDAFYREICRAHLEPVLASTERARQLGMHVETVTLVIPGLNDSPEEIDGLIRWVIDHLGDATPMHFTRFHPDYQMQDRPATPIATLERIYERARELGLLFPYLGNVGGHRYENTWCPRCGALLIERRLMHGRPTGIEDGRCRTCGEVIPVVRRIPRS